MLTAYAWDIRFMHVISILSDDDESPALDSEDSWNPANSEAESDSVDEEAAEKLQNENRNGTYTLPAGEERTALMTLSSQLQIETLHQKLHGVDAENETHHHGKGT